MNHEFKITTIGNKGRNELLELLNKMSLKDIWPRVRVSTVVDGIKLDEETISLGEKNDR